MNFLDAKLINLLYRVQVEDLIFVNLWGEISKIFSDFN